MKPITKEQYHFIENNFVVSKDYNLDFESINRMLLFERKIKKIGFLVKNEFIQPLVSLFSFILTFASPISIYFIFVYIEKINYEVCPAFSKLIIFLSWFLTLIIIIQINEKFTFERTARSFALFLLFFLNFLKYRYYIKNKVLFGYYVKVLKLKVANKIENQNNLIKKLRWLYHKSIPSVRESLVSIKKIEAEFNSIKEINTAFQLELSDNDKSYTKNKNSDWWITEEVIHEIKSQLENEIIKREKEEVTRREKEIEREKIRNEKRLLALAEYEKKREENKIKEENRLNDLASKKERGQKLIEEGLREISILLGINESQHHESNQEEEKFQEFLKKQHEKTEKTTKQKTNTKQPKVRQNKAISSDKLKEIINQKITTGKLGEEIVFEELKSRLIGTTFQPLIEKFRHVSKEQGDGSGYDILAYNENAEEIYVEVKSTTSKYPIANFSKNELDFAEQFDKSYVLFLVYNLNSDTFEYEEFIGYSKIKEKLNFQPVSYKLKTKNNLSNQDNKLNL